MRFTARADTAGIGLAKVQVGNPVADGSTTAEGQHQQFVGVIHGEEACHIAKVGGADERLVYTHMFEITLDILIKLI
jgi:hypothetical protein